ncbi:MAG: bifunctional tetrahydrofolate synthase/dihydrofolate synthase, partial [Pseudomonadales bacterium]|nr:bifunctional tetrahydrofolate synthase/dihydrofolate synthase [Pseudomonadales bacterium]
IEPMLQHLLPRVERWYPAEARTPRSATSGQLVELLRGLGAAVEQGFDSVTAAIDAAEAAVQPGDRILIFGSFYTVAEALEGWQARQAEPMV